MKFEKYHGLGNDFVIVNYKDLPDNINLSELAIKICNRFTGIGSDGFVVAGSKENNYKMTYIDPSGYRDSMCGNAIRCLAYYYKKHGYKNNIISIETDDGLKIIKIITEKPFVVEVNMESFDWNPKSIPVITNKEKVYNETFMLIDGTEIKYSAIKFGPAHVVIYSDDLTNEYINNVVYQINKPELFPESACFNFAKVIDKNNINLRTWERGIGITLACGTGSCATAAISFIQGYTKDYVNINQTLGKLTIREEGGVYLMQGPAEFVYKGELKI